MKNEKTSEFAEKVSPKVTSAKSAKKKMIALRDYDLSCPPHAVCKIKKGDDLSDKKLPAGLIDSLRTMKVI